MTGDTPLLTVNKDHMEQGKGPQVEADTVSFIHSIHPTVHSLTHKVLFTGCLHVTGTLKGAKDTTGR